MTKKKTVAALYDVHGNLPALEAVLAELRPLAVDEIVVGGDVVPGPMASFCLEVLGALHVPVRYLRGNGENDLLALRRGEELVRVPSAFHPLMRWVAAELTDDAVREFQKWPATVEAEVEGLGRVLFCHGTPRDDNEIFTERTPEARLVPVFDGTEADLVVCGHTHMQFDRTIGGIRVVNAGSVGLPFGDPGAFWLLLVDGRCELRRTPYDFEAAAELIRERGYPRPETFQIVHPPAAEQMIELFEGAAIGA